jgi:hypothetical protein
MEKSTKLIIAAIGLGGLGYFLYKKGLFAKTTTTEVAKDVKKVDDVVKKVEDIVKDVIDTSKKTAVEPPEKEIVLDSKPLKPFPKLIEEPYTPIFKEDLIYPKDINNILLGTIDTTCFCFHSSFKNLAQWNDKQCGDYYFITSLITKKKFNIRFINFILTRTSYNNKIANYGN